MRLNAERLLRLLKPASRTGIVGCVDGLHRGQVRGWAMDADKPGSRLMVRMVDASGAVIAHGLADRYRADVQKAGYGDGYYGFALPVAGAEAVRSARFVCGSTGTELPKPSPGHRRAAKTIQKGSYTLYLDGAAAGPVLTGWAVDRHCPKERRLLCLRADRKLLGEQRATLYRPDAIDAGSDGFHGFCLPLPRPGSDLLLEDVVSGLAFGIA